VPAPADVGEDEAAQRLAVEVAGPGVTFGAARFGQLSFTSASRGLVHVEPSVLDEINALGDILLLTADSERPVDGGEELGVIKCSPLFLSSDKLLAVERIRSSSGPVLEVRPFLPFRIGLIAPRARLRGNAFDRAREALSTAAAWYGSELESALAVDESVDALAAGFVELQLSGVDLVLGAGAAGTDPLDLVFEGLRRAGGTVDQIGIPAEPGTACWIGRLDATPVLGLASCELFGQPGALDLLFPRLFTGEPLDERMLRRIALGGLLRGPSRIAPFHVRSDAAD
jgi:hypothetical protein